MRKITPDWISRDDGYGDGGPWSSGGPPFHWPEGMRVNFLPKIRMEIVVENKDKSKVIGAILSGAWTGEEGDGKIFISAVKEVIRIRTGEKGAKALSGVKGSSLKRKRSLMRKL